MENLTVCEAIEPAERVAFFAEMRRLRRRRAALVAALRQAESALGEIAANCENRSGEPFVAYVQRTARAGLVRS